MELFLDIDGVILDFESSFMDFIRENYLPELPMGYIPKSWEMKDFPMLDVAEVWNHFVSTEAFTRLGLLVKPEVFNKLAENSPIHLITNLPYDQYSRRQNNLDWHNLNYTSLHLAGHYDFGLENYPTKSSSVAKLRTPGKRLIFMDDHPANCMDIKTRFPESEVFLMNRLHNQDAPEQDWTRVNDWDEFLDCIQ